jgi:hypothetical protein
MTYCLLHSVACCYHFSKVICTYCSASSTIFIKIILFPIHEDFPNDSALACPAMS